MGKLSIRNHILLIIICYAIALVGLIFEVLQQKILFSTFIADLGFAAGNILGILLLVKTGSTLRTIYFKVIAIFIAVYLIGILFRIRHWPLADEMIVVSLIGIFTTYLLRTLKKKPVSRLDVLKFVWLSSVIAISMLIYFHWIEKYWAILPNLILWATLLLQFKTFREATQLRH